MGYMNTLAPEHRHVYHHFRLIIAKYTWENHCSSHAILLKKYFKHVISKQLLEKKPIFPDIYPSFFEAKTLYLANLKRNSCLSHAHRHPSILWINLPLTYEMMSHAATIRSSS